MANETLEAGFERLAFARRVTLGLAEEVPEKRLCQQPCPGANHALWILGHVAWTDDFFMIGVGGLKSRLPDGWHELFSNGSTPQPNVSDYPPIGEIHDVLAGNREALVSWLKSLDEAALSAPLPGDFSGFAPNFAVLPLTLAWHEGLHAGQLTVVRKSLGIKPMFG